MMFLRSLIWKWRQFFGIGCILEYKRTHAMAKLPTKLRGTDAAYDLYTVDAAIIGPHETKNFSTGLIVTAPPGWYYTIEGRSGLARQGIKPFRGIIDSTYVGHLMIALTNSVDVPYEIVVGDRIAQMTLHRVYEVEFKKIDDGEEFTHSGRGTSGFGASGR